jgi:hypothetical protein
VVISLLMPGYSILLEATPQRMRTWWHCGPIAPCRIICPETTDSLGPLHHEEAATSEAILLALRLLPYPGLAGSNRR